MKTDNEDRHTTCVLTPVRPGHFTEASRAFNLTETRDGVSVSFTIPNRSSRYFDELIGLDTAPELLALRIWPNSKEVTEAMAAYRACVRAVYHKSSMPPKADNSVAVFVIGDGSTPRLGALIAFRTKWRVTSIDPQMNDEWVGYEPKDIKRLWVLKNNVEDVPDIYPVADHVVLAFPHSHATTKSAIDKLKLWPHQKLHVVWLPCCRSPIVPGRKFPDTAYDDHGIWSQERAVYIWRDVEHSGTNKTIRECMGLKEVA